MAIRWVILITLFAVRIVTGVQYQTIGALAPYLVRDLGIDYAQLGTLIGLDALPGIFLAIPAGWLGRRFGDKRVVSTSLALMACGGLLTGFGGSFGMVAGGRILSGIGSAMLNVLLAKMAIDWFAGREIVTAMALLVSSWPLGIALGLVVLPPLASAASWRIAIAFPALMCFISLLLVIVIYRPAAESVGPDPEGRTSGWLGWRTVGLIGLSAAVWGLFNAGYASIPSFGPAFLATTGYSVADAGTLVSVAIWLSIPSVQIGGYLAERLNRPNLIIVGCMALAGTILALVPAIPSQIALYVAYGLIVGIPAGNIMALPASVLRPADRAIGMGIFSTFNYSLIALSAALAGWTRDLTGAPAAPLYFGVGAFVAAVLALAVFRLLQTQRAIAPIMAEMHGIE